MSRLPLWILGFALILPLAVPSAAPAQSREPFTIEDYFKVVTARVEDWTRDGRWLALSLSATGDRIPQDNERSGDPTYIAPSVADLVVVETATAKQIRVFPGKTQYRGVSWSPDGRKLAMFVLQKTGFELRIWDREAGRFDRAISANRKPVASNSPLEWSDDGKKISLHLRAPDWDVKSREAFQNVTRAPIMVFDSKKPFLPWDEVSRRARLVIPALWDVASGSCAELLPETPILSSRLTRDGRFLVFERDATEKTSYETIGGTKNQLEALPLSGGEPRVLLKPTEQRSLAWTRDNRTFAWVEKGDVFLMGVEDKDARQLTGEKEIPAKPEAEKSKDAKKKQSFSLVRFSPDNAALLCTSTRPEPEADKDKPDRPSNPPRQYWMIGARTGETAMLFELPEKEDLRPNLQVVDWSPDGRSIYFSTSAADRYDRGLVRYDIASKTMSDLVRTSRFYAGWRMAEDGSAFLYRESDGDHPDDLSVAPADLSRPRRILETNPQLAGKALSRTELITYRDADGKTLRGVLYYPANYEKGKSYPLVTEVYESYFENGFSPVLNILTSAGYAVLHPSVNFTTGYPGEAWAKGALAAVNTVVEMGVADPERLGIQGTSYGGYATVLLITQTDRFKAAINNSGKVDMLSFYTQSPRLGVRNTHAPEKSQDRLGGTLWEYPERYLAHSAILQADRIKTPLLCITGDQDPNVEALQSQEIFVALRRLGKTCVWLRYHGGAHGGPNSNEERKDMYQRMLDWYNTYLTKPGGK
jgi:dipeptidyl aminopeptidase/acylaminoacyl peptidase